MLLFSCCIQTTSFPFVHLVVTLLLLNLDHFVPLRPSWCYSSPVVFRPHRFPSSILMLLFSCCIQTTSFPFVHPDVTLLLLYLDYIVPFVHPDVTLLLLYLYHIVPLRPSWCYSSPVVLRLHLSPSSILMLLFSCCVQTTSFPFVHPDVTLLMLYLDHIVPLRPSWCYSSPVVLIPHRSPSSILMLLFSCCI